MQALSASAREDLSENAVLEEFLCSIHLRPQVEGGHNSPRPAFMLHSAAIFFHNTLRPSAIPHALPAAPRDEDEALLDARAEAASPRTRPGGVEGSRLLSDADGLSDFSESNSSDSSGSEAESSATGSELGDSRRRERDGAALPAARLAVQYPFLEEKASPASSSQSASQIEKRATAEEGAASLSAAISVDASSSARPRSLSPQPQPQGERQQAETFFSLAWLCEARVSLACKAASRERDFCRRPRGGGEESRETRAGPTLRGDGKRRRLAQKTVAVAKKWFFHKTTHRLQEDRSATSGAAGRSGR